jgi:DNA-binding MarR family transcriptional regulator
MAKKAQAIQKLFDEVSLGAPENAVGFLLWRVSHRYVREMDRALEPLGLTHLQFETLIQAAWLSRSGDLVTQSDLARFGEIHPMQTSQMLKTLEAKGLIARVSSESDRRAKHVQVTAPGLGALRRSLPRVLDVQVRFFGEEGRVGGTLLAALLALDRASAKTQAPVE